MKYTNLIAFLIALVNFNLVLNVGAQSSDDYLHLVADHWLEIHDNFRETSDVYGNYTLDLTLEAMLYYDLYTHSDTYTPLVLEVMKKREVRPVDTVSFKTQPFCSINFTIGLATGNTSWYNGFIAETYRMQKEIRKTEKGAVMVNHSGKHRVLLDFMQEYASRMAKAGYLSGDTALMRESVNQFLLYEDLLKDSLSGLWHQGIGWCEDSTLTGQGAWSRGHGWLLRGLVLSLLYLPDDYREILMPELNDIAKSLLVVQDEDGMFHILLNLPHDESAPDVSGTGMIAFYMAIAIDHGWLDEKLFSESVLKASNALKQFIGKNGEVFSSSKGPGPLCSEEEYIKYKPEVDEKHGFQGVICGLLSEIILQNH